MNHEMIIEVYQDEEGNEPFTRWLHSIKDHRTRARMEHRLERVRAGNFGDSSSVGEGVFELRLHVGAGYRIYYGRWGDEIVVLLCGGSKRTQKRDIPRAKQYWEDYKRNQNL